MRGPVGTGRRKAQTAVATTRRRRRSSSSKRKGGLEEAPCLREEERRSVDEMEHKHQANASTKRSHALPQHVGCRKVPRVSCVLMHRSLRRDAVADRRRLVRRTGDDRRRQQRKATGAASATHKDDAAGAGAGGGHPYGVKPWGNYLT